jgi:hypothetical protein
MLLVCDQEMIELVREGFVRIHDITLGAAALVELRASNQTAIDIAITLMARRKTKPLEDMR